MENNTMHAEHIAANLKIYQEAQVKLKTIVKSVSDGRKEAYYAIVKVSDSFYLFAALYRAPNTLLYVRLYRDDGYEDCAPKLINDAMSYEKFIRAFPEFGRRNIWREDWEPCREMLNKKPKVNQGN